MNKKTIHFVGIKGVGMTALAVYCKERGFDVRGSDTKKIFHTDTILKRFGIKVYQDFRKENITHDIDLVIYSGAYEVKNHPEIQKALKMGIKTISHGQALGEFMRERIGISIAGTHGKTTSTALLATILTQADLDPSYIIGAAGVDSLSAPGHYGKGKYFIAEADEYQTSVNFEKKSRFLWQNPLYVLITNIDYDHPDVFKDINDVKKTFRKFIQKIPKEGFLFYNSDDKNLKNVVKKIQCQLVSFGESRKNKYFVKKVTFKNGKTDVEIQSNNTRLSLSLNIPGKHNAINVCGVYALAKQLGVSDKVIKKAIENFTGSKRRFEKIKKLRGVLYYDDYAHHPTEIVRTLEGAKDLYPNKRLIVVFQPHTFSRTQSLIKEFSESFAKADIIIITDIFSSAREKGENFTISGRLFASYIAKKNKKVYYANSFRRVVQYLEDITIVGDIVITMGAGDIYKLHEYLK